MFKNNKRPANPRARATVRILAGGYLIYLAWSMRDSLSDPLLAVFAALFVLVGAAFVGTALYSLYQQNQASDEENEDSDDTPALPDSEDSDSDHLE